MIASLACRCGARDEVREPCPDVLDCWLRKHRTMIRYVPESPPPPTAGRTLGPEEART